MDYNSINFKNGVIDRLQKRQDKLEQKGNNALLEGNVKKMEKSYAKASKVENRKNFKEDLAVIKAAKKK